MRYWKPWAFAAAACKASWAMVAFRPSQYDARTASGLPVVTKGSKYADVAIAWINRRPVAGSTSLVAGLRASSPAGTIRQMIMKTIEGGRETEKGRIRS